MSAFRENYLTFWNYYIELESEFVATKRYVEFSLDNRGAFSIEFLKLYQAVCSEIDVIGKEIAKTINPSFNASKSKGILQWYFEIQNIPYKSFSYTTIPNISIRNYLMDFDLVPWNHFKVETFLDKKGVKRYKNDNCSIPSWWRSYNSVKHARNAESGDGKSNYHKANFGNLLNAITALYALEMLLLDVTGTDNELTAFYNDSILFSQKTFATCDDLEHIFI